MRILFLAINAKYIHPNPAVRILTTLANSKVDADFYEFTIHDSFDKMIHILQEKQPDIIGASCYIWNIEIMMELMKRYRKVHPNVAWVAGGPEVSYDPSHFLREDGFDYVVGGDGECSIMDLISYIKGEEVETPKGVATRNKPWLIPQYVSSMTEIPDITTLYKVEDLQYQLMYVETSRGCPFRCAYCLSSIGPHFIVFQPLNVLFHQLNALIGQGAKTIKFLDRTFNIDESRFLTILKHIVRYPNTQFHFEIAGDLLREESMDWLCNHAIPNQIRLEIGVQSNHTDVNESVGRYGNLETLRANIQKINESGRVIIHTDLIAGLPFETIERFEQSFNDVFLLGSAELQLGFLKLLRGTTLRGNAASFGYHFNENKPPYEIESSTWLSSEDLVTIKMCERGVEAYWNRPRAHQSLLSFFSDGKVSPFQTFIHLGKMIHATSPKRDDEYFEILYRFYQSENQKVMVIQEYLLRNPIRPKRFWQEPIGGRISFRRILRTHSIFSSNELHNACLIPLIEIPDGGLVITYNQGRPILWKVQSHQQVECMTPSLLESPKTSILME